ncbi:MAG: hypothetical protein V3V05_02750 [Pontiella sp.]
MNFIKISCSFLSVFSVIGCTSTGNVSGPEGPKLVSSGHTTEAGSYAEVGVQFTSIGDFVAVVSPSRWINPVETGGSLSWINPVAWSDDTGRTGRILLGEAVLLGGIAIAATADDRVSSESSGIATTGGGSGGPTGPPTPPPSR